MEKLYDARQYSEKAVEATREGKFLYLYDHTAEYEVEVLEYDMIEEERIVPKVDEDGNPVTHEEEILNPIYDEEGEIIGYDEPTVIEVPETEVVTVEVPVPRMVEEPVIDPETGEPMVDPETGEVIMHKVQAHHTETREKMVEELLVAPVNFYILLHDNVTDGTVNPNYEEEEAAKEAERVGNLKCTKRVFALMLQELGISYSQLKELISTSEEAQLEWDLCVELQRNNPLINVFGAKLGITPEQLDMLFKVANNENTVEELRELAKVD